MEKNDVENKFAELDYKMGELKEKFNKETALQWSMISELRQEIEKISKGD